MNDSKRGVEWGGRPWHQTATAERPTVDCDEGCGAYLEPVTLDEYRAALEHRTNHSWLGGCSHGC